MAILLGFYAWRGWMHAEGINARWIVFDDVWLPRLLLIQTTLWSGSAILWTAIESMLHRRDGVTLRGDAVPFPFAAAMIALNLRPWRTATRAAGACRAPGSSWR